MMTRVKTAILSGALVAIAPGMVLADQIEKKGTSPYVTHFIFRPVQALEVSGLGTATLLEAVGTTQNMKGEKMFDKMSARCTALSVDSGPKKYIDGACVLADADGDKIFSTFDTRDVDVGDQVILIARRRASTEADIKPDPVGGAAEQRRLAIRQLKPSLQAARNCVICKAALRMS
jgi:hypothetical protein